MKLTAPSALLIALISGLNLVTVQIAAAGQVVLYEQTFPYGTSGNFPVSIVGWANDIPDEPTRLYQNSGGDGAVYAYENGSATTAFYTTTSLSTSVPAAVFPAISPSLGVTFYVDIQPYVTPGNVKARFAVQMNGANWFAGASFLPVPSTVGAFATYSNAFNPAASQWRALTVSGNGTGTGAIVGGAASANLTGMITGAGLVFTHSGAGTFNFDNFLITASNAPKLSAALASAGAVALSWPGAENLRLQSTANPSASNWSNLASTAGMSATTTPTAGEQGFFRLAAFPTGALQDGDFESNNLAAFWQSSGSAGSVLLRTGGAFSGANYLQHSNAAAYQAQTSQLVANLPNGYYKLTAMVENSGGQAACYLSGNDKMTSLPVSASWTNTIVRGIAVTNGQCLVGLYSNDTNGGNWCGLDFVQLIKDDLPFALLKGGDVSELTYVEQGGGKFYETNGQQMDCLQILKNHGCNIVRLRLYNDPGNPNFSPSNLLPPGIQSPTNILALAARAKALGLQIELTFYYSDYWSNVKPHDWVGLSFPQLTNALYGFTSNFMAQMAAQGTTPEYVSLGNEMQGGILLPDGSATNFANLAQLLNLGYAAVKVVSPSTKVILHIAEVDAGDVEGFFNQCVTAGVNWDIIGCSYYPFWTGLTAEQAEAQVNQWYSQFNKPVIIMETGYNWASNRCDGFTGQLANNGPEPFPSTQLGQKEFMLNCFNAIKLVNQGHCLGDLYWDPIFICVPGEGWELGQPNVVDNTTLFDFNGHALPSLDAFLDNN